MSDRRATVQAFSVFSSKGKRPASEDHVLVQDEKGIFVIADGFGGPLPGAEAAKTACEAVRGFLFKEAGDLEATLPFEIRSYFSLAGNVLFNSLIYANDRVLALNKGKNVHEKGGASVLAGFIDGELLALANVGACTAWLFRNGEMAELVAPRTYGRMCDPVTKDTPSDQRIPLMALGVSSDLEPEIYECRLEMGDWIVFYTDGVDAELRSKLVELQREGLPAREAVQKATSLLESRDFHANSTVSLIVF